MFTEKAKDLWKNALAMLTNYYLDIFVYFCFFVLLYVPPIFVIGSVRLNALYVVGAGSILFLLYKSRWLSYTKQKQNLLIVGGFLVLAVYGFVLVLVHGTALSTISSQLHYIINVLTFSFVFVEYCRKRKLQVLDVFNILITLGMVQAIIAVLTMIIPPLKQLFIDMLLDFGYNEVITKMPHRMFGFSGSLTFATPVVQSMIAVICFYLCFVKSTKYYIPMALLVFTSIINARTSIITFAVGVVAVLLFSRQWGWKHMLKTLKLPLLCLPVVAICVVILYFVMPSTVEWVLTGIGEIFSILTGNTDTPTFNFLLQPNWWKLPDGIYLVFGVGSKIMYGYENLSAGIQRVSSDVGYINDIWYGGIVFAVIQYAFFYYLFYLMQKRCKQLSFFAVYLMIVMPIINIKGIAFSFSCFTSLIVVLVVLAANMEFADTRRIEQ